MKALIKIAIIILFSMPGVSISFAQVAIRTDIGVVGYKTTCFDPLQVSSTPGFGFQLGADYDIHIKKRFYLTPGLYWSYRAALGDSTVEEHRKSIVELDANIRAFKYFDKYIEGFNSIDDRGIVKSAWKFDIHPIIGYDETLMSDHETNRRALEREFVWNFSF